jgi:hypothetical protein
MYPSRQCEPEQGTFPKFPPHWPSISSRSSSPFVDQPSPHFYRPYTPLPLKWTVLPPVAVLCYWGLCRLLRYRRRNSIAARFKGRDPYSLSIDEAQWIVQELFQLEMPYLTRFSTAFALFRTYGILTISKILLKYVRHPRSVLSSRSLVIRG